MRRIASPASLAAAAVLLAGCHYASSPFVGFGDFIGDTHTITANPNQPPGNAENMRRVEGADVTSPPLLTEPGNIWPGPQKPDPTLEDLQRQQNDVGFQGGTLPGLPGDQPNASAAHPQPRPYERGSSTPPPGLPQSPDLPLPATPRTTPRAPAPIVVPPPTITTPNGPAVLDRGNGVMTATPPGGSPSIVVPNGNGTSTVIGPDGTTTTVPTR